MFGRGFGLPDTKRRRFVSHKGVSGKRLVKKRQDQLGLDRPNTDVKRDVKQRVQRVLGAFFVVLTQELPLPVEYAHDK